MYALILAVVGLYQNSVIQYQENLLEQMEYVWWHSEYK